MQEINNFIISVNPKSKKGADTLIAGIQCKLGQTMGQYKIYLQDV
jgi:hypothetical protein